MVSAENEKVLGVFNLVGEEKADGFEGLFAPIDIVTQEEVVGLWREATVFKQSQQIIILAVNIT